MKRGKILVYNSLIVFALLLFTQQTAEGGFMFLAGKRPQNLGIQNGELAACPGTPNCVSSFAKGGHYIEPLAFGGSQEEAMALLKNTVQGMKGTRIVKEESNYLYAEFSSRIFGFVDDAEFLFDGTRKVIHVRSASRLGYSDFGVNRKRIEGIRREFHLKTEINN